jgi:predicted Zn-dependent protease
LELYRAVLAKWPHEPNVRNYIAGTLIQLAETTRQRDPRADLRAWLDEADSMLQEQCRRTPDDVTAWLARAQLAHIRGQARVEREMFERAIQATPHAAMPYAQLANRLGQQGRFADALAVLERAPPRARANPVYVNEQVQLLAQTNRVAEAVEALRDGLARWPDNPMLRHLATHPGFRGQLDRR